MSAPAADPAAAPVTAVQISGGSDDLIEVDGALSEEFSASAGLAYVAVSTGDLVRMRFEREGWRAEVIHHATGGIHVSRDERGDDVVVVPGPVAWVMVADDVLIAGPRR